VTAELWDHQKAALTWAADKPAVLFHVGMGGGKSRTAIELLEYRQARRVLVLCPMKVRGVWAREPAKWSTRNWVTWDGSVPSLRGKTLANPTVKQRAAELQNVVAGNTDNVMCCLHYDIAWREPLLTGLLSLGWDTVIFDEIHRIKSPSGKASKACARIANQVRADGGTVIGLTGTLMPHSGLDVFAQLRAVDPSVLPGTWTAFRAEYGQKKVKYWQDDVPVYLTTPQGQPIYDGVARPKRAELMERASQVVFTVPQEELDAKLGLLPPTVNTWIADPDKVTADAHQDLERDGITLVQQGVISAANAMVALLRMSQVTSGSAPVEEGRPGLALHDPLTAGPKARLLDELLEDIAAEPVVVFCRFRHDLDVVQALAAKHRVRYAEISGRRSDALTDHSQLRPDVDLVGVQIQSGGVGIDLTRARHAVFYAVGHNLGDYLQAIKRVHRPGQARHVVIHHLQLAGTVDQVIALALERREDITGALTAHLSRLAGHHARPHAA
jgi:SNF2 family DNA or RNA helicase